jgi:hypothetical protein
MSEFREAEASQTVEHNEKGSLREPINKELSSHQRLLPRDDRGWKLSNLFCLSARPSQKENANEVDGIDEQDGRKVAHQVAPLTGGWSVHARSGPV